MLEPAKTVLIYQKEPGIKEFSKGEVIFTAGEIGTVMYGVLEGVVDLFVGDKAVETINTGDVFGEGALVHESHKRATTAIAKTNCKLAYLDKERFLFAVHETPVFALEVMRSYSCRLRRFKESF
ncbi:cyclic nucleotide-binding domain-containing protein [Aerosakkonemataceae cyanobacterium BLCC-F154]|uniref:Cyclic nucleotide-binding domain-containing protein n=1 Tax=Floridaenema fluviatile BLCC-F154 TaxID=3153640 RepID=A0ABV4YID3_9CYAN